MRGKPRGGGCKVDLRLQFPLPLSSRTFASSTHEYLVDLLQYQGEVDLSKNTQTVYHAFFNHPTTEIIWTLVSNAALNAAEPFCYNACNKQNNSAGDPLEGAQLQLNGYSRFNEESPEYFRELVPSQYHTAIPQKNIYVYSFSLEPEDFRPSGSINLSRIDNVKLTLSHVDYSQEMTHPNKPDEHISGGKLRVYARSKNVLRIKSGMAGLAYAN